MAATCASNASCMEYEGEAEELDDGEERFLDEKALERKIEAMDDMEFKPMKVELMDMEGKMIAEVNWHAAKWATGYYKRFWRMMLRELKEVLPASQQEKFTVLWLQDRTTKVKLKALIDIFSFFSEPRIAGIQEIFENRLGAPTRAWAEPQVFLRRLRG